MSSIVHDQLIMGRYSYSGNIQICSYDKTVKVKNRKFLQHIRWCKVSSWRSSYGEVGNYFSIL